MGFTWSLYFAQEINAGLMTDALGSFAPQRLENQSPAVVLKEKEDVCFFVYVDNIGVAGGNAALVRQAALAAKTAMETRGWSAMVPPTLRPLSRRWESSSMPSSASSAPRQRGTGEYCWPLVGCCDVAQFVEISWRSCWDTSRTYRCCGDRCWCASMQFTSL